MRRVACCGTAHEISAPQSDWLLKVQQSVRGSSCALSGKCRRAVLDARTCETNFGRRVGSASQRARRRSRKGRRKTRSESLNRGKWAIGSSVVLFLSGIAEDATKRDPQQRQDLLWHVSVMEGSVPCPSQYEEKCPGACIRCRDMRWLPLVLAACACERVVVRRVLTMLCASGE